MNEPLRTFAREAGFVMKRSPHTPYTVPALEATEYAKEMGLEMPFHHACFRALWERGEDIEKTEVLSAVAEEVGLDPRGLEEALRKRTYADAVQASYQQAIAYGINGIPAFTIGRYLFTGAHPYDFFKEVVERVLQEGVNAG